MRYRVQLYLNLFKNTQQLTNAMWLSMQKVSLLNFLMTSAEMNAGSKADLFIYFISSILLYITEGEI